MFLRFRIVQQSRVLVIEKLGKFSRIAESGFHWLTFTDKIVNEIDLRTKTLDTEKQTVITKDNVTMTIDAVVYFKVIDPYKATYNVEHYLRAMILLTQTTLRNEIGRMDMEEAFSSKEEMNKRIGASLDQATNEWGVKVERVEIKDMLMSKDIQDAMDRQMKAEREKREKLLQAEGDRESAIMRAEGEKQSSILYAQAERESELLKADAQRQIGLFKADAEAKAIELVARAEAKKVEYLLNALKNSNVDDKVLALKQIEAFVELAKGDNKVFVPYESSSLISSFNAVKELLSTENTQSKNDSSHKKTSQHTKQQSYSNNRNGQSNATQYSNQQVNNRTNAHNNQSNK